MAEPTPPISASADDYFLAEVSLACVAGVGGLLRKRLVDRFGSPRAVLTASPEELTRVDQVGPKLSRLIPTFADDAAAGELITLCRRRGVDILVEGTGGYPRLLGQIRPACYSSAARSSLATLWPSRSWGRVMPPRTAAAWPINSPAAWPGRGIRS
jgi:NAD-dependent DNA ligase